jgi:hypothetical protein
MMPLTTVKNAAIARAKRILSSSASLIDSIKGGIFARGFVLGPKL